MMNFRSILKGCLACFILMPIMGFVLIAIVVFVFKDDSIVVYQPEGIGIVVCNVQPEDDAKISFNTIGTGFVVGPPYVVVTCEHVIKDRKSLEFIMADKQIESSTSINFSIQRFKLQKKKVFSKYDLAVLTPLTDQLSLNNALQPSKVTPKPGDSVFVSAYHSNEDKSLKIMSSFGTVTDTGEIYANGYPSFLFTSLSKPGYSGSPVLNMDGNVIGVVHGLVSNATRSKDGTISTVALKIDVVKNYLDAMKSVKNIPSATE